MQRIVDAAIILGRRDYGEADKIISFLTREHGKLSGMVKGARRAKSKLAGGIELFSIASITFMQSPRELKTIVSTELTRHYGEIVKDLDRTMWAYEVLKLINNTLSEEVEDGFFGLLQETLEALNNFEVDLWAAQMAFYIRWIYLHGRQISTQADDKGNQLKENELFNFSYEDMSFVPSGSGIFDARHLKLLRVARSVEAAKLTKVQGAEELVAPLLRVLTHASQNVI